MKCRDCVQARRYSAGAIRCIEYGMILRDDHECTKKGAEQREDQHGEGDDEAEAGHPGERSAGALSGVL